MGPAATFGAQREARQATVVASNVRHWMVMRLCLSETVKITVNLRLVIVAVHPMLMVAMKR